jgi:hypothetical protein
MNLACLIAQLGSFYSLLQFHKSCGAVGKLSQGLTFATHPQSRCQRGFGYINSHS